MLFNSLDFVFFYAVVFGAYALLRRHWTLRKGLLLLASYWFYMAWNPPYVLLLVFSTLLDFVAGQRIARSGAAAPRRAWLVASCVGNLGCAGIFQIQRFPARQPRGWWRRRPSNIPSSCATSCCRSESPSTPSSPSATPSTSTATAGAATDNLLDFAVYVSFFPQLVAGPIIRAATFLPQLARNHSASSEEILSGFDQIARGFAKKLLGADLLAGYVDLVYASPGEFGALNHLLAIYAYAFQIYFDFSGYSDIAIGTARSAGLPGARELPAAVPGARAGGLLDALAHQPLDLASRLPLHCARRLAPLALEDLPQSRDHDAARGSVARRGLGIRPVGGVSRDLARDSPRAVPRPGRLLRVPRGISILGDVPPRLLRVGALPRRVPGRRR